MISPEARSLCEKLRNDPRTGRGIWRKFLSENRSDTADGAAVRLSLIENSYVSNREAIKFLEQIKESFSEETDLGIKARYIWKSCGFLTTFEDEKKMLESFLNSNLRRSEGSEKRLRRRLSELEKSTSGPIPMNRNLFCSFSREFLRNINETYPRNDNPDKDHLARKSYLDNDRCRACYNLVDDHFSVDESCPYIGKVLDITYDTCDCGILAICHQENLCTKQSTSYFDFLIRNILSFNIKS